MKHLKRLRCIVVLAFAFVCLLPLSVSANSPPPADHLVVELSNLPAEAVYADLLIKIDENDHNYTNFQPSVYGDDVSLIGGIAEYAKDGYASFTLHYKQAKSNIRIEHYYDEYYTVDFCNGIEYGELLTQYENLCNHYNDIKIAILDKDFKIIAVSDAMQLPKETKAVVFTGSVYYDVAANSIYADTYISPYFILFGGFFSVVIMLLSIGTELVVAMSFAFKRKQLMPICIVNACSQILMRVLYIVLPFTYLVETVILEALVYLVEFLIYRKRFEEMSTGKILSYTVVANTLSLLLGLFLDCCILA